MELYELRQFVTFVQVGTLSKAAQILHLSQPALSRNMKKLEDDLNVTLFNRHKNKLQLNENGQYVYELAQNLLNQADDLVFQVRAFDRRKHTIHIGTCAPAPLWILIPLISRLYPQMSIQTDTESDDILIQKLEQNEYQLIVTHERPTQNDICFKACGQETIFLALPKGHRFARRKSISLAEMNGENMLLLDDIGFWHRVQEQMPDSKFLIQEDYFSLKELVQASTLPCFTSDLARRYIPLPSNRIQIPIKDKGATVTYYLACKKERKRDFQHLFLSLDTEKIST